MSRRPDPPDDPPADPRGDSPDESSGDSPGDAGAESPADSAADKRADSPAEARDDSSADKPADKPADSRGDKRKESAPSSDSRLIGSLAEQFRVIGELRGPTGAQRYVAIRNDDHTEVVIDVFKSTGSAGNELAHLASDIQLRSSMSHPKVVPIIAGEWLDSTTYACVSGRIKGDTLQERLDRGDRPGTAEVATILNDVKAVLDWARAGSVVHRGVSPDSIIIEQDTNRLLVTLGPTPIPLAGLPGEVADARMLGALAWSLFSGRRFVDDDTRPPLGELCPNLAARVIDATERILRTRPTDRTPDAAAFIGIVAVGDVLKQAEVEFAALDEEFASHFTGERTREPSEAPERMLTGRKPGTRESIFALGTIAALVLMIALGVGLVGRTHREAAPIVAQQMPTIPAAGGVDSGAAPMRNDSILTHSAAGNVAAESTARSRDSLLRDNAFRDSILRDSITRDRIGRARRMRDSVDRDSLDRDNARRDSLDEDAYRRDSVRNAIRAQTRRDSERQDSIRRDLARGDSARIDSLRNQALLQDSIRRETAKRDSIRRDSVRRDTIPRRPPDSVRPDSVRPRPDSIRRDSIGRPPHHSRGTTE